MKRERSSDDSWSYTPAPDLDATLTERLKNFPRQPHMWMYVLRTLAALIVRSWLKLFHRFEVQGIEHLPIGKSFVMVANHQSHLDTLCLSAVIPLSSLHRTFPAAAADYFFKSLPRSLFFSTVVNALPFSRTMRSGESLNVCRTLLQNDGNILIIFPEGTRSKTGKMARFRPGIGLLVQGSPIAVLPCHLEGAHAALPKGALLPRWRKLRLRIGPPRDYRGTATGSTAAREISTDLQTAVAELAPQEARST